MESGTLLTMKLKSLPEVASLVALFATPVIYLFAPNTWTTYPVGLGLDVKDLISIIIILILSFVLLSIRLPVKIRKYFYVNPFYEKVEHHFFYHEDGTFILRSFFIINSGWTRNLTYLPSEGFMWFNAIPRDRLHYRLIHYGRRQDREIHADHPVISPVQFNSPRSAEHETAMLSWRPQITPAMQRFETLAYQVEVTTPNTETAAFDVDGTVLGFGVAIPTIELSLNAFAPPGYAFKLLAPKCTVRHLDSAVEIKAIDSGDLLPRLSVDETVILVNAARPKRGRRYWIHYRFEKVSKVRER